MATILMSKEKAGKKQLENIKTALTIFILTGATRASSTITRPTTAPAVADITPNWSGETPRKWAVAWLFAKITHNFGSAIIFQRAM
jgi:hypothetical protein